MEVEQFGTYSVVRQLKPGLFAARRWRHEPGRLGAEPLLQTRFRLAMLRILFMDKRDSPVVVGETSALSRRSRFLAAVVGGGLLVVLAVASQLRPDPRGWGTHEQLGLPPCTFLTVAGVRCPACGMTTAWSNFMHGRIADALRATLREPCWRPWPWPWPAGC